MIKPAPITAYVGVNGSGKSLSAVAFGIRDYERTGRPLVTNMLGLSIPHVLIEGVEELPEIMEGLGTCNVLLDEAGAMFAARDTGRNKAFEKVVQQLRKYDARLLWTAPAFARADKILREVTFMAVLCMPLLVSSRDGKAWPSTRVTVQKAYDVSRIDNSGTTMNRNARPKGYGLIRTKKYEAAFDSFAVAGRLHLVEDLERGKRAAR